MAIPNFGADCLRVTRPFAANQGAEAPVIARLAFLRHVASVRPEPGSNSPLVIYLNSLELNNILKSSYLSINLPFSYIFT